MPLSQRPPAHTPHLQSCLSPASIDASLLGQSPAHICPRKSTNQVVQRWGTSGGVKSLLLQQFLQLFGFVQVHVVWICSGIDRAAGCFFGGGGRPHSGECASPRHLFVLNVLFSSLPVVFTPVSSLQLRGMFPRIFSFNSLVIPLLPHLATFCGFVRNQNFEAQLFARILVTATATITPGRWYYSWAFGWCGPGGSPSAPHAVGKAPFGEKIHDFCHDYPSALFSELSILFYRGRRPL